MTYKYFIIVQFLLFSYSLCEISVDEKEKLLNGFIDYYNKLPNQIYTCNEGSLQNTQQVDETIYRIEATLKVTERQNADVTKSLKCTATVQDSDNVVTVTDNHCQENVQQTAAETGSQEQVPEPLVEVTEPTLVRKPVQLDNEVQSEAAGMTSGEQFIAIPRDQPSAPCIGCATHVNPQAAGVSDLANLGVRHLDIHEPAIKHNLNSVLDVERQVQVVNGVRYILILSINFDNCSKEETENCAFSKTCKITILAKPWVKLPNGANYRAILANNCTEEWQYGDNGEVLPELTTTTSDGDIRIKHSKDVQSLPNQERSLTDEEIKTLQEQIIPNNQFLPSTESHRESGVSSPDTTDESKQHVFKIESGRHRENSISVTESEKIDQESLSINPDKKKAIDELLDYFDFSGLKPKPVEDEVIPRIKRSYDYDLQVLSLTKEFHEIKKSIENAKFVYEMAQAMVDYLNEMDMEVKNRAVKSVIKAEEELQNSQHFVYVQASVTIPCDKVECEPKDTVTQICNGVIDSTNRETPQILNTFCYNDNKERDYRDIIKEVDVEDPVLQKMAKEAVKKIESESTSPHALKINKIVSATTQTTSGTLSKISVIVDHINCSKSVPLVLRINCTVIEQLGSKICEIITHDRYWLKEKKISYTCTDRPVDMRISKTKSILKNITVNDPKINEMLQEAIQYLETQSNKNNKQKIVSVKSISTQIIAGFLTKIEFVVGYTNCTDENYPTNQLDKCALLNTYGLRICKAQIWDRSWIMDGRQVEVSCDDAANEIDHTRKKRSIDLVADSEEKVVNQDLDYKQLAEESLKRFLKSSSSPQHYKVVKVDRVDLQTVAKKLIKMDFTISPTNCLIQSDGRPSLSKCIVLNSEIIFRCHSKILQQVWVDKKQYSVNCNIKDQKQNANRNINEPKEQNPTKTKYYHLAEESLNKYLNDTSNSLLHRVVKVEKVTTQTVSGLLTTIDFIISPKSQNTSSSNTTRCNSKILEKRWLGTKDFNVTCDMKVREKIYNLTENPDDPKYMQIAVEALQKYIKDNLDSYPLRVTFVDKVKQVGDIIELDFVASRGEDDDGDSFCHAEFTEQGLLRNDIDVTCHLLGTVLTKNEITEEDPNYLKYVKLADESLHNYLQSINSSQLYTIISIGNVTVQWDEGLKIRIDFIISPIDLDNDELQGKRCLSEIREQPWLHKKRFAVKCEIDNDIYRMKREIIAGAPLVRDPTNPQYTVLAKESLRKYVQDTGSKKPLEVVRVVKVTTQVVSGSLIRIEFLVSGSPGSNTITCKSKIWKQPWIKKKEIDVSCEEDVQRGKREVLLGGLTDQDPSDPQYHVLAKESLQKYVQDTETKQPLEVVRVVKVTTQVVSGSLTRIEFLVSGSPGSNTITCKSKIWAQPWINKKEFDVACEEDVQRGKREVLPGGETDQDPSDPKYHVLAKESLQKHVQDTGSKEPLEVVRVVKVTTQVVSGLLIRIEFLVSGSPGSNTITCKSKIWEQPWIKKNEIDVSCEEDNQRGKREVLLGGLTDQDPSDPQYHVLAKESLQKYVQDTETKQPLEVVRVVKVTTQVVSGSLTRIEFLVSGSPGSNTITCKSKIWAQPWINKKEFDVSCEEDVQRGKREVLPGGETDQDPSDPKYHVLAKESLQKHVQDTGSKEPLEVVRVVKVTTQVVSGSLTRIEFLVSGSPGSNTITCKSKIWAQPWINKKEFDVSCEEDVQRGKREVLLGGLTDQDPSDPQYHVLAKESLQKYVQDTETKQPLEVVKVVKVTTQVVSGWVTRIEFLVSDSLGSNTITCKSEIWEQPWIKKKEIDVSCEEDVKRGKREVLLGGLTDQDPSDPKYHVLAKESLQKYVQDTETKQPLEVVRVVKVTTQVVSGSLTRIEFLVSGSPGSNTITCKSKIWAQPWINKKEFDVSCEEHVQRGKREVLPGGLTDQDPSDPQYHVLAKESLQKYVQDTETKQPLEVVRVVKVTTQVVSGSLTRIEFLVSGSPGSNTITCKSKIWAQPWINKKEFDVSCEEDVQRGKREVLPGGLTDQDPSDPQYHVLAKESLQKYVQDTETKQPLEVVRVVKVTTQVVSGSLTRIEFLVSGSPGSNTITCKSKIWAQPWINKKEFDVSCEEDVQRGKREVLLGGLTDQDPSDPQYHVLAKESLQKYVQDTETKQPLEVVKVVKVTTQVVSGWVTRIEFLVSDSLGSNTITCKSEIWEQPWIKKKEIDVSCEEDVKRVKRDVGVSGDLSIQDPRNPKVKEKNIKDRQIHVNISRGHKPEEEQDPNKEEYKLLAEESLRKYQKKSSAYHKVVSVKRVSTRVVSGIKYNIDFDAAPTECLANVSNLHARRCKVKDDVILYCHAKIWDRPWLKQKKIDVECYGPEDSETDIHKSDSNTTHSRLKSTNLNNNMNYKLLAQEALEKYLKVSNRIYVHKVTDIISASENFADGTITKIEYIISPTTCLRNETRGSYDMCDIKQPLTALHCNAIIWDRPWMHVEKDIKINCKKMSRSNKHKRESGVRAVRQSRDDTDDIVDEDTTFYYADRAVQYLNDHSTDSNLHKLVTIHAVHSGMHMKTFLVRMYIELAETYCLRHHRKTNLHDCEEMDGLNHKLCLARLWPSPDDELVVRHVSVVCDDNQDFPSVTALNIPELLKMSLEHIEMAPDNYRKLVHQGEPYVIPSLDSKSPIKLSFIVATTNCSKTVDVHERPFQCFIDTTIPSKACHSFIWLVAETRTIQFIDASCTKPLRSKRSTWDPTNVTADNLEIQKLVTASLEKLEMASLHRYKQRVLQINSHSTKITSGKVTTIDFDVGYTSCLKYEWVESITSCDFIEHLPRRRCVSQIFERLWINNGKNIEVNCVDDDTPLESHIEFESAEMANQLANEALRHIEAKYPHPRKQKVVRIFSLEKQAVAGIHYRMKVEVGFTDCLALSEQTDCKFVNDLHMNKFCRVNVWVRPWSDHPPNFRVTCDYQEGATHDLYHQVQAEHLFYNFLTTYSPSYVNDFSQLHKRFEIFKKNIKKIHELNVHEKGTARYGVTRFTDLTYEEFRNTYTGLNTTLRHENQVPMKKADVPNIKLPENFDWREFDAVTEVKDQGSCGSCWAFSVTGNIEGQWKMQSGQLVSLSEQELVDCDKMDDGCNGGLPDNAYRAIEQLGGLELESDYPYEGEDEKCEFNKTLAKVQISGAVNITTNETGMAQWLVHNGPISIGINANAMQFYMGGISHPWKMLCNPTNLDHGVLIVGYGVKDYPLFHKRLPYWIVKNSWGKSWGEQGYYRVYRGDGTCGVNQMASSAVI